MKSNQFLKKAFLLVGFFGLLSTTAFSQFQQNPIVSPEIHDNGAVTFRIMDATADSVKLSGTRMQGWGASEDLSQND
ncbi:MAG: hypothetical protein R3220_13470 [Balneolaceae bacterium]|nr:hypothetical protein [Balneolaceae bacterium]